MNIIRYEDRDQWLAGRLCRITGSRLKDIVVKRGTGKKIGFYELIAERIGIPADNENAMDRGQRLEPEAIERFEAATGKKVDTSLCMWTREDGEHIAVSPDGFIAPKKGGKVKEAVEVKCLGSARHIEAVLTNEVPDEYHYQVVQYFAVNDDLEKLYFVLYDPRLKVKDFHTIEVTREQVQEEVTMMLMYQRDTLQEVERIAAELMAF
jgi:predicted phage-related endonuclease